MDLNAGKQLKKIDKSKNIMILCNNKSINCKIKTRKKKRGWMKLLRGWTK
jgi:hypothetical protein